MLFCFLLYGLALIISQLLKSQAKIVEISNGLVNGETRTSPFDGSEYFAFHAIPYAKPLLSELRSKPPEPFTEKWSNTYDASNSSKVKICPQLAAGNFKHIPKDETDEDCLYLSVYTPKYEDMDFTTILNPSLPVMIWIHGGSFDLGTGMFPWTRKIHD